MSATAAELAVDKQAKKTKEEFDAIFWEEVANAGSLNEQSQLAEELEDEQLLEDGAINATANTVEEQTGSAIEAAQIRQLSGWRLDAQQKGRAYGMSQQVPIFLAKNFDTPVEITLEDGSTKITSLAETVDPAERLAIRTKLLQDWAAPLAAENSNPAWLNKYFWSNANDQLGRITQQEYAARETAMQNKLRKNS